MLKRIRGLDPVNIVRFFESFEHRGHICLAFEMLDKNLHEVLKERRGNSLSLQEIKPITQQVCESYRSITNGSTLDYISNILWTAKLKHF